MLKTASGKPLRANVAMDVWALGLIFYELFTSEPLFFGCSDGVALQVVSSSGPIELPLAKLDDTQAQHLLQRMLAKRPRERPAVEAVLKHSYLVGGLDTREVSKSFAMLHEAQAEFKGELSRLHESVGAGDPLPARVAPSDPADGTRAPEAEHAAARAARRRGSALADKRAAVTEARRRSAVAGM